MASFYYCDESALGLLLLKPHWITEFKYQRQNEMNPGLITKKMSACKWPINNIDLWGGGGGGIYSVYTEWTVQWCQAYFFIAWQWKHFIKY